VVEVRDLDAVVIGGGFFGCSIAAYLARQGARTVVLEEGEELLGHASYANQARVHNGYHYPRAILTALRSRVNFPRFLADYGPSIVEDFDKYYAIGKTASKVTAAQFHAFCRRIEAPLEPAPPEIARLFNPDLIQDVFRVRECAFDALKLRDLVLGELLETGVTVRTGCRADRLRRVAGGWDVVLASPAPGPPPAPAPAPALHARYVFNCTYASLNRILARSGLPLIPLKHEMTEMALVTPPDELRHLGVTVMCGPFFSTMPFPPRGLHTLSHVRYTPHYAWRDRPEAPGMAAEEPPRPPRSHFPEMIRDAARYLPSMRRAVYRDSIWQVKTVLPESELDDSRPILFLKDHGGPGLFCIMGGKIDNVYDMYQELDLTFPKGVARGSV